MAEPQGLQRVGDVTFRDVGKGVARYKGPIALFLSVALLATILPNHGKGRDTEASTVASGSGLSSTGATVAADGGATDGAATDTAAATDPTAASVAAGSTVAGAALKKGGTTAPS